MLVNGEYVKDLSRLGRDMRKVIILDVSSTQNSPSACLLHPSNGFPIKALATRKMQSWRRPLVSSGK